jgi:regulator of protease activity HflC (stomatin/prohibitin superfamily)
MAFPRPAPDWNRLGQSIFKTRGGRTVYLGGVAAFVLILFYNFSYTYVGPNQFAIKQVIFGPGKGIKPDVLFCGLHWVTPGAERLYLFPTDIQVLSLTSDASERGAADKDTAPALNIQTSEGYNVIVDVSVLYRVENPYKVMTSVGPGRLFEQSLVAPRSEQILRKRLGELDAEEFYDVQKRLDKERLALDDLNAQLVPAGVHAIQVFVRKYTYDPRYQQAIEQRKIQDQTVFMNKAQADMAQANAEKDRIVAVGQANVKVELARGDAEKQKLAAQAENYERTQRAEGGKALQLAEAEGTRLEAAALQGRGSEFMVGLKMADALKGTRIIIVPTDGDGATNPLDLKTTLKRFDVTK